MMHQNYLNFSPGEIVVLSVPFSNQRLSKLRPALVISNDFYHSNYNDVLLLKITSIGHNLPFDIQLNQKDLEKGELIKKSVINCAFIITTDKKIIKQKIGKIKPEKLEEVKEKLKIIFDI